MRVEIKRQLLQRKAHLLKLHRGSCELLLRVFLPAIGKIEPGEQRPADERAGGGIEIGARLLERDIWIGKRRARRQLTVCVRTLRQRHYAVFRLIGLMIQGFDTPSYFPGRFALHQSMPQAVFACKNASMRNSKCTEAFYYREITDGYAVKSRTFSSSSG